MKGWDFNKLNQHIKTITFQKQYVDLIKHDTRKDNEDNEWKLSLKITWGTSPWSFEEDNNEKDHQLGSIGSTYDHIR